MARGFVSTINRMAREAERSRKVQERSRIRHAKAAAHEVKQLEKFERQAYLEARQDEAQAQNEQLAEQNAELNGILAATLAQDLSIDFDRLRKRVADRDLDKDRDLRLPQVPMLATLMPQPPGFFGKLMPGAQSRHRQRVENAEAEHATVLTSFEAARKRRASALADLQAEADRHNAEILSLRDAYKASEAEGVISYFEAVFQRSEYPDSFPQEHNIAFVPESKQLVVDYEIPPIDEAIPTVEKYRYVKSSDDIVETKRTEKSRQALYASVLAQTALRFLHEVFASDAEQVVDVAVVSIFVSTIDRATGRPIRPCLVSVRLSAEQFADLHLERVEPAVCLRQLRANVSGHPSELCRAE